jgi:hypothetical protein
MSTSNIYQFEPSSTFAAWFRGLIGQAPLGAELHSQHTNDYPKGYREGQFMRVLFKQRAEALDKMPEQSVLDPRNSRLEQVWQSLRQQALTEGLWSNQTAIAASQSASSATIAANQSRYALVASVAVLAIGLTIFMQIRQHDSHNQQDEVVFRGDEQAQHLAGVTEASAKQFADKIEAILKAQAQKDPSLRYTRKQISPTDVQIQAKVLPQSDAAIALTQLGVEIPEHGRLNLVIGVGQP